MTEKASSKVTTQARRKSVPAFGVGGGITVYKALAHQDPSKGGFISSPCFIDEETETQKCSGTCPSHRAMQPVHSGARTQSKASDVSQGPSHCGRVRMAEWDPDGHLSPGTSIKKGPGDIKNIPKHVICSHLKYLSD